MIILDQTIVNVALPAIQRDLGFSSAGLAWVVNAYLIAFGGLLLLAGRLGDLIGRRRVFLAGLAVFSVASLLCGLATSPEMLIGARFLQGVGGAFSSAVILGMIVTLFPQPGEQARAIGVFSFVASAGASIGLLAGGVLTEALDWHWIFFVNVPIGAAAWLLAARLLEPDTGAGWDAGADAAGRGPGHRRADARRLHDRRRALRHPRCARGGAARGLRRAPGDRGAPAAAPASAPVSQCRGRERRADADGGRTAGRVLPLGALPPRRARLRRARGPARRSCRSRSRSARSHSGSQRG